jgi:hypothetical protein
MPFEKFVAMQPARFVQICDEFWVPAAAGPLRVRKRIAVTLARDRFARCANDFSASRLLLGSRRLSTLFSPKKAKNPCKIAQN